MIHRFKILLCIALTHVAWASTPIESTVALVDQTCITHHDVTHMIDTIKARETHAQMPDDSVLYQQALTYLIEQEALFNEAKDRNILMTDADLARRMPPKELKAMSSEDKASLKKELAIMTLQNTALYEKNRYPSEKEMAKLIKQASDQRMIYTFTDWLAPDQSTAKQILTALKNKQAPLTSNKKDYKDIAAAHLPDAFHLALNKRHKDQMLLGPLRTGNGYHVLAIHQVKGSPLSEHEAFDMLRAQALRDVWPKWTKSILAHHYIQRYKAPHAPSPA